MFFVTIGEAMGKRSNKTTKSKSTRHESASANPKTASGEASSKDSTKSTHPNYQFSSRKLIREDTERELQIREIRSIGWKIFGALVAVNIFYEPLRVMWLSGDFLGYCAKLLLAMMISSLVFFWNESTIKEFTILNNWASLDQTAPPSSFGEMCLAIVVVLVLAALFYTIINPLWFAIAYIVYSITDLSMQSYVLVSIRKIVKYSIALINVDIDTAMSCSDNAYVRKLNLHLKALRKLEEFYFSPSQWIRRIAILVCALLTAGIGYRYKGFDSNIGKSIILFGFFLIILGGEIWIYLARRPMYVAVKVFDEEFRLT